MKLMIDTDSYNEKRYGKPWIALVDFSGGSKGDFKFGEWCGDARNGSKGILTLEANAGDVIARGQRDTRKVINSAPCFYLLNDDGTLSDAMDKSDAYKHFLQMQILRTEAEKISEGN